MARNTDLDIPWQSIAVGLPLIVLIALFEIMLWLFWLGVHLIHAPAIFLIELGGWLPAEAAHSAAYLALTSGKWWLVSIIFWFFLASSILAAFGTEVGGGRGRPVTAMLTSITLLLTLSFWIWSFHGYHNQTREQDTAFLFRGGLAEQNGR